MPRRLLNQDRQRERIEQQRLQDRIERRMLTGFRREIATTMDEAARRFESTGKAGIQEEHTRRVNALLKQDWQQSIELFAGRVLEGAKGVHGPAWTKQGSEDDIFQMLFNDYVRSFGAQKVQEISGTTQDQINLLIERGRREGLGVDAIAKQMRDKIPSLSNVRASVIARTETHGSANYASKNAAKQTGLRLRKEWISAEDDRTRDDAFDHVAADGETVDMDAAFQRTGEDLDFPGDPTGSPGNIINCRCAQGFVEIED